MASRAWVGCTGALVHERAGLFFGVNVAEANGKNLWKFSIGLRWGQFPEGEDHYEERVVFVADVDNPDEFTAELGSMIEDVVDELRVSIEGEWKKEGFELIRNLEEL